jgi:hypothetical protein
MELNIPINAYYVCLLIMWKCLLFVQLFLFDIICVIYRLMRYYVKRLTV